MAEFLTTKKISSCLEDIIEKAQKNVVIISPFIQTSKIVLERLVDAGANDVKIIFVHGKDELKEEEMGKLLKIKNLELYYYPNLHAKCYFNEKQMIITSMNLYESSEKNREMGIRIDKKDDEELYLQAFKEAQSIKRASKKINSFNSYKNENQGPVETEKKSSLERPSKGICIRCSKPIPYDFTKPLCYSCFSKWVEYANDEYPEKYCHQCGKEHSSSMARPECIVCYKKSRSWYHYYV